MTHCRTALVALVATFVARISAIHADPGASWWDRHKESISCARPGYFVNPADCRSFYRCVDRSTWNKPALQRYDFTCPSGQVFDVAFSVCTNPGPNGCADPWWPGSGENPGKGNRPSKGPDAGSPGEPNSIERAPSLFDGDRESGGLGGSFGGDPLDVDFGSPSLDSSTRPGASLGLFKGGSSSSFGGDPLDADFGASPGSSRKQPGENSNSPSFPGASRPGSRPEGGGLFGSKGGGSARDPLDADFGSSPVDSGLAPGGRPASQDLFGNNKGGNAGRDPLDADFGSPPGNSDTGLGSRPGAESRGPFSGSNGLGGDPLDNDFGPPTNGPSSGENIFSSDRDGSPPGRLPNEQSRRNPGSGNSVNGESWWGSNSNDRKGESSPNSIEFDNWNNAASNDQSKPGSATWGGSSRPALDNSPWRPTGPPWGSGSSGNSGSSSSSIPESPPRPSPPPVVSPGQPHNRPSWWDPPYANPYRPPGSATVSPRPVNPSITPDPWLYPYRPRYPAYQIVAYPTWPPRGPYDRRPIIVVYSNSRK